MLVISPSNNREDEIYVKFKIFFRESNSINSGN